MYRINSINSVNNFYRKNDLPFRGNTDEGRPQINNLSNVQPDYSVKVPMQYIKLGEMNFPYDVKAHVYKLANGQRVVIVPQSGETVLKTYVNTGSMNEPDKIRGISHYIEHNLFNGSQGLEEGDFFKQVDKMGASTNASTGFAETNYYISSNLLGENDLENKIKLHASMIETPIFAAEKLEKEKGIVNSEINMITSDPENLAVNTMLKNLYGIKTTSTDMIGGTTDNITNLTREDVVNYYNNNYYPANMTTVITGEVEPEQTIKLISKYFTSKKKPTEKRYFEKLTPIQNTVREDIISDKATATSIVTGFNGAKSSNIKDRIYLEALANILTNSSISRIDKKIKPLNGNIWTNEENITATPDNSNAIIFTAESSEENSEKVLKVIFNEISNIANNPPTDEEMQIAKKSMLNRFSSIFEHSYSTNNEIGKIFLSNNKEYIDNYENIVKTMTAEDIVNVAKKYLDVNKASVTLVHPKTANSESITKNYKDVKDISFTGRKEAINLNNVKEYNMPNNNFRIVTNESKTDNCYANISFSTDNQNINNLAPATILNYLLEEGTLDKNQEEFQKELQKSGIKAHFDGSKNSVHIHLKFSSEDMKQALEEAKKVVDNPRFTQESFDYVKNKVINNIKISEKSAFDKLDTEIFKGLPSRKTKEEVIQELENCTLDDVKRLYNTIMTNSKASIAISAPFQKKPELNDILFKNIASYKKFNVYMPKEIKDIYTPINNTKVLVDTDFKNQAEIIEAFKFRVGNNLKDKLCINLMNIILGGNPSSRLFSDLREKQKLAYHVGSDYIINENIGMFYLKIGTTTENKDTNEISYDNVQKSIDGFNKHINKMKTEKVSEEELNNAKLALKNTILNTTHSSAGINSSLSIGINSPYGISYDNQALAMIDEITVDDIYNTANYIFTGKPVYSILATENTISENKEYLKNLELN